MTFPAYLQPEQWESWKKKTHDPDWSQHRYRDAKDRAMMSAVLEIEALQAQLATRSDAHLLRSNEALGAQLYGCELAARDYAQAAEYGKTVGFGDEFKAVLVCRDSLNAAIQRYLDAEAKPVNQVLAVSIAEEAFRLLASHVEQNSGFWTESAGTIDATVYWAKAREAVHARAALTEAAALEPQKEQHHEK